jgi:hypothetical protein
MYATISVDIIGNIKKIFKNQVQMCLFQYIKAEILLVNSAYPLLFEAYWYRAVDG